MNIVKRCDLCDTAFEFEADGQRLAFTAHDAAFCAGATRERIRMLGRALEHAAESRAHVEGRLLRRLHRQDIEIELLRGYVGKAASDNADVRDDALRTVRDRRRWDRRVAERLHERQLAETLRFAEMQRLAADGPPPALAGLVERIQERSEQPDPLPSSDAMTRAWDAAAEDVRRAAVRDDDARASACRGAPADDGFVARVGSYANIVTAGPAVSIPAPEGGWPGEDEESPP